MKKLVYTRIMLSDKEIRQVLILEDLGVPKAHNPINPTLNTVGVQCGVMMPLPCVS